MGLIFTALWNKMHKLHCTMLHNYSSSLELWRNWIHSILQRFQILSLPQRHFCVFALSMPTKDALGAIYNNILGQHMAQANFNHNVRRYCNNIVQGAIALHSKMISVFLPTAIKFHYIFNLRDMSNIFQVNKNICAKSKLKGYSKPAMMKLFQVIENHCLLSKRNFVFCL